VGAAAAFELDWRLRRKPGQDCRGWAFDLLAALLARPFASAGKDEPRPAGAAGTITTDRNNQSVTRVADRGTYYNGDQPLMRCEALVAADCAQKRPDWLRLFSACSEIRADRSYRSCSSVSNQSHPTDVFATGATVQACSGRDYAQAFTRCAQGSEYWQIILCKPS